MEMLYTICDIVDALNLAGLESKTNEEVESIEKRSVEAEKFVLEVLEDKPELINNEEVKSRLEWCRTVKNRCDTELTLRGVRDMDELQKMIFFMDDMEKLEAWEQKRKEYLESLEAENVEGEENIMTIQEMENMILEEGFEFTENGNEAIYILENGKMISGYFVDGCRTEDHRMVEIFSQFDRYDNSKLWDDVGYRLKWVMLVPETGYALVRKNQTISEAQRIQIEKFGYEIELY